MDLQQIQNGISDFSLKKWGIVFMLHLKYKIDLIISDTTNMNTKNKDKANKC